MATESESERLFQANRGAIKSHLLAQGMSPDLADRWLTAWEGTSNQDFDRYRSDFWSRAGQWALAAWTGGQQPPSIE